MAQAGKLRHRVEIQSGAESRDAHGQTTLTWTTAATRWAHVEPLVGRELFAAQQAEGRVPTRITMRRYAGLTVRHRLLYGARVFELTSVPDAGISQPIMELLAVEDV